MSIFIFILSILKVPNKWNVLSLSHLLTLRIVFMSISVLTKGMSCLFFCFCACCMNAQVRNTDPVRQLRISGYLGQRIDACIEYRVKTQDVDHLVEPFRHKEETSRWQSEFWGFSDCGILCLQSFGRFARKSRSYCLI